MEISINLGEDQIRDNCANLIFNWENYDQKTKINALFQLEPILRNIYIDTTTIPIYNDKQEIVRREKKLTLHDDERKINNEINNFLKNWYLQTSRIFRLYTEYKGRMVLK